MIGAGTGDIVSQDEFGDCQLHLEFAAPVPPKGRDQGRGNSGVMLFGRYEIQVLDSFENRTYADGQAAAIYGQFPRSSMRRVRQASGRHTTSFSRRLISARIVHSSRPPTSRCCITACSSTTTPL